MNIILTIVGKYQLFLFNSPYILFILSIEKGKIFSLIVIHPSINILGSLQIK